MKLLGISDGISLKDIKANSSISIYRFIGRSDLRTEFETIVRYFLLLDPPVIPIAVYRMSNTENELKNEMPYIVTNPKKDLELNQFDQVICIGKNTGFFEKLNPADLETSSFDQSFDDSSSDSYNFDSINSSVKLRDEKEEKKGELEDLTEEELLDILKNEIQYFKKGEINTNILKNNKGRSTNTSSLKESKFTRNKKKRLTTNVEKSSSEEDEDEKKMKFTEVKLNLVDVDNEKNKISSDEISGKNSSSISSENSHSKSKKSKSKSNSENSRSSNSESKSKMEEGKSSIHGDNILKAPSLIKVGGIGKNSTKDSEKLNANNIAIKDNEVGKELIEDKKSEEEKLELKENNTNNNFLKKDDKKKENNTKDNTKESSLDILNKNINKKNQINDKDYKEDIKVNTMVTKEVNNKKNKEDNIIDNKKENIKENVIEKINVDNKEKNKLNTEENKK
jgi:CCR4-NOT transcription complex subunit 4